MNMKNDLRSCSMDATQLTDRESRSYKTNMPSAVEMYLTFPIRRSNGLKGAVALQFASQCCFTQLQPSTPPPPPHPHPVLFLQEEVDLAPIAFSDSTINARPQKDDTSHYHLTPFQIRAERCLGAACDWLKLSAICRDCSLIRSV